MIRIGKVVLNIGVGGAAEKLQKAEKLLAELSGQKPVKTNAKATITEFSVKKYSPIGVKVTLRGQKAKQFLAKAFVAVEGNIKKTQFDANGNLSFGIAEYIELPGTKYDPDIGMFGLDVSVNIERFGYRITRRKLKQKPARKISRVSFEESSKFLKENFKINISE